MSDQKTYQGRCVHYQETRLRIRDGLPKIQDVPKAMGGSGITFAE